MPGGSRNMARKATQSSATPDGPVEPTVQNHRSNIPFTSQITTQYGPTNLLGRFFLDAYAHVYSFGVQLSLEPISDLVHINAQNLDSWPPLVSIFDARLGSVNENNCFCIVGRDLNGRAVYTQAARLYDCDAKDAPPNFCNLVETLNHVYPNPQKAIARGEEWHPRDDARRAMSNITGRFAFSGAAWCHPEHRKRGFTGIIPRIARAYAHTLWNTKHTVTFMTEAVVRGGQMRKTGYTNLAWDVETKNTSMGNIQFGFLWMDTDQLITDLEATSTSRDPQVDRRVVVG